MEPTNERLKQSLSKGLFTKIVVTLSEALNCAVDCMDWRTMVLISKNDVPQYLRNGSLYGAFDDDGDESFEVPSDCFKTDLTLSSLPDLRFALRSLRYWGVIEFPIEVYQYMIVSVDIAEIVELRREFVEFENQFNGASAMKVPDDEVRCRITRFNVQTILQSVNGPVDAAVVCDVGLEMVRWLHGQHFSIDVAYPRAATADRHLPILKYFVEKLGCEKEEYVITAAVLGGSLSCLEYLLEQGFPLRHSAVRDACYHSHPHILKFLLQRGLPFDDSDAVYYALRPGNMKCFKLLHEAGCTFDNSYVHRAVHLGNVECLKYLHEHNLFNITDPGNVALCAAAADRGHLSCLQYLHEHHCPWDHTTKDNSMMHYECLKYAHEHGCPWGGKHPAISSPKCFIYVVLNGPPRLWALNLVLNVLFSVFFLFWCCSRFTGSVHDMKVWDILRLITGLGTAVVTLLGLNVFVFELAAALSPESSGGN